MKHERRNFISACLSFICGLFMPWRKVVAAPMPTPYSLTFKYVPVWVVHYPPGYSTYANNILECLNDNQEISIELAKVAAKKLNAMGVGEWEINLVGFDAVVEQTDLVSLKTFPTKRIRVAEIVQ